MDRRGYWFCRKKATMRPGTATTETARTTVVSVSPSTWMVSLSKKRRKKWSIRTRVTLLFLAMLHLHDVYHLLRDVGGVGLLYELSEDAFERGQLHQTSEIVGRGIGYNLALGENDHSIAYALDHLHHMRDVEDGFALSCEEA